MLGSLGYHPGCQLQLAPERSKVDVNGHNDLEVGVAYALTSSSKFKLAPTTL